MSPYFLDRARDEFAHFEAQMSFRTLDVNRALEEQGFEEGTYDVVVADNVLHVSSNLAKTIRYIRRALKPGGKLIAHEAFKPDGWTVGFVMGVFPGWWLGVQDNRPLSPNVAEDTWNVILQENGFSGVDLAFRDFEDDAAHHFGWMISTSIVEEGFIQPDLELAESSAALLVVDETSNQQCTLAEQLGNSLNDRFRIQPRTLGISSSSEAALRNEPGALIILLADFGPPWLNSACEESWDRLKQLVHHARQLLWVSAGGGRDASPEHAMLDGLARTLRYEDHKLHLVTAALDPDSESADQVKYLTRIVSKMITRAAGQSYEQDYIEIDSRLHVRRLVDAESMRREMNERLVPYDTVALRPEGDLAFQVSTTEAKGLDGGDPFYALCPVLSDEAKSGTVDIAVKAVSLLSRDRDCALGLVANPEYGSYCSGHVMSMDTGINGHKEEFEPGDRVFAAYVGSYRSQVRAPKQAVVRLPPELSLALACQTLPLIVTVYHALIEVADVRRSDSILVHNGASALGETTLRVLADRGFDGLWTTVRNQDQSDWVRENLEIPAERILPRGWFDNQDMLGLSYVHKFDVVFDTGSQDPSPLLSLDLVASGGRLIVLEDGNDSSTCSRQSIGTHLDVSLVFVRPPEDERTTPGDGNRVTKESLRYAVSLGRKLVHQSRRSKCTQLPASELVQCFDTLRHMNQGESVVMTLDEEVDMIHVS